MQYNACNIVISIFLFSFFLNNICCYKNNETDFYKSNLVSSNNNLQMIDSQKSSASLCENEEIKKNLKDFSTNDKRKINKSAKKLLEISSVCSNKNEVLDALNAKANELCSGDENIFLYADFLKLEKISTIFSEVKYVNGVRTLIGCINHTSINTGLSNSKFPAKTGLIKYGTLCAT